MRNTVPRPPRPLCIPYPLLTRRRLRPAIASAAMPAAAAVAAGATTWNNNGEEAQRSTSFKHLILNFMAKGTLIYGSHGECRNRNRGSASMHRGFKTDTMCFWVRQVGRPRMRLSHVLTVA